MLLAKRTFTFIFVAVTPVMTKKSAETFTNFRLLERPLLLKEKEKKRKKKLGVFDLTYPWKFLMKALRMTLLDASVHVLVVWKSPSLLSGVD